MSVLRPLNLVRLNLVRIFRDFYTLSEGRVLIEQLRLILHTTGSSTIPAIVLAFILVETLSNPHNAFAMQVWFVLVVLWRLFCTWDAKRIREQAINDLRARCIVVWLMLLNAVDMLLWGALAWLTLETSSLAGSVLVIAVLAAIASNSMSALSPVLPVFVVTVVVEFAMVATKVWQLHDPAYDALGLAAVLYTLTLFGQSRASHFASRAAIDLRFENAGLIGKLQIETEHARQNQQLAEQEKTNAQRAQINAEHANLAKSKFLAAASHDLRQPIHALGLFLEVLSRSGLTTPQREQLNNAIAATNASGEMLNTLLDFSRIEAGVIELNHKPFHVHHLFKKIEKEIAPLADAKNLLYRSRDSHIAVYSDPALIELILRNLVVNAVRYTEKGGIFVCCRRQGAFAMLEVWDTGIGIAQEHQLKVFDDFYQLNNPARDRNHGLGLGLAIVMGLVKQLGHEITLKSIEGRGSVFKLRLPISYGPIASDGSDELPYIFAPLRLRVLFVDDDEIVREAMLALLQLWHCECELVESIEDALRVDYQIPPDLIISDYRLRDCTTGAQVIAALREKYGVTVPALLITGDTAPLRLREAKASGIPLLHKPVAPKQLYQRIADLCKSSDLI